MIQPRFGVAVWRKGDSKFARELLHEQHLARSLDRTVQAALIMRRQARVFPRQDPSLVRDKLLEQVDVFEIKRVNREINLRLRARCADLIS